MDLEKELDEEIAKNDLLKAEVSEEREQKKHKFIYNVC